MKSIMLISVIVIVAVFTSCNTHPDVKKKFPDTTSATDSIINSAGNAADPAYREGARLIAADDCFTCHRIAEKSTGPSYKEIAARYSFNEGVVDNLSHVIIRGGKGIWGDKEMTPHPTLDLNDAKEMVRFILSLDTTNKSAQ